MEVTLGINFSQRVGGSDLEPFRIVKSNATTHIFSNSFQLFQILRFLVETYKHQVIMK